MKKILYTLSAALVLGACSTLDQDPANYKNSSSAITTVEELSQAVNGAYYLATYGEQMTMASELALYGDVIGPDSDVAKSSGQFCSKLHERSVTSNDSWNAYGYLYKAIANINKALAAAETIDADESEIAPYVAELKGMRGVFHFHLATFFAPIPTSGSSNTRGIVLSTEVYPINYTAGRATLEQTYQQIIDDLTACIETGLNTKVYDGHVNMWAALALRARAYLYWGKYDKALADAKNVIENSPYSLYTIANYTTQWAGDNASEMILEYIQSDDYNAQRYAPGYYTNPDGYTEYTLTTDFYNFLTADANDVRSQMAAYLEPSTSNGKAGYYALKYPGKTGSTTPAYCNNIKVVRLSEMYLIAAEATLQSGGTAADAAGFLNTLRKNRITGYTDVSTTDLDDILNERRKELFAEGQIALDYWRMGKSFSCGGRTFAPTADENVLPIPKEELDVNGDILEQNPGY